MKAKEIYFLALIWMLTSCKKVSPAGFWENYKSNFLIENISEQGPYGGHRAMYWEADKANTSSSSNFIEFAKENGWTLVDSSIFNQDRTDKWIYSNAPIFPLTNSGFSDTVLNNSQLMHFPRWFSGQIIVYKFKTSWVTIEPGTDNSIETNGFVVMNKDKTKTAVYHLWGE